MQHVSTDDVSAVDALKLISTVLEALFFAEPNAVGHGLVNELVNASHAHKVKHSLLFFGVVAHVSADLKERLSAGTILT